MNMGFGRWIGIAGAVVYGVGFFLVSSAPGGGDVDASDFEDFYVTDESTALPIIGLFVLMIGVLALLWFFHELRTAVGTGDGALGWATAALGLAIVPTGASILAGPSGVQAFSDADFVGAPVAHAMAQAGFAAMLIPGSLLLGAGIALLSFAGRRAGVLVPWVAIAGLVAGALQLLSFIWIPHFAIPLWVILVGAVGARVTTPASTATSTVREV
jgi:hypothetical protein